MTRPAAIAVALFAAVASPSHAQQADMADAVDVVPIDCVPAGETVACTVETERPLTFCMAVDVRGEPVANSTGATDDGEILFQGVDPSQIVGLRCR